MFCQHHAQAECFSCPHLAMPYPEQLRLKTDRIRHLLKDLPGKQIWLPPATSSTAGFRNKAKLVATGTPNAVTLGLPPGSGNAEVDLGDCPLYEPPIHAAIEPIKRFIKRCQLPPYQIEKQRGDLKYVLITAAPSGELMVRFVLRRETPIPRLREHLPSLQAELPNLKVLSCNIQPLPAAVIEGPDEYVLSSTETLTMDLQLPISTAASPDADTLNRHLPLHLGTRSFFQTNTAIAQALYAQVWQWAAELQPHEVWDLYCGVGGFALTCADALKTTQASKQTPKIFGMEISAAAITSAQLSAQEMQVNAEFLAGDAGAWLTSANYAPDLLIVNPPRRGIGTEAAAAINQLRPRHLVYSSCNPRTLAKDLRELREYEIEFVRLMDMFNYTDHAEVIALLKSK